MKEDDKVNTPDTPAADVKPETKLKVPRILLEILVVGSQRHEAKVKRLLKDVQSQFDALKTKDQQRARLLWIKDDGTKTPEEARQWLIDNSYSKYYIFVPDTYSVKSDFVKEALKKINALETALTSIKMYGLVVSRNKPNPSAVVPTETPEVPENSSLKVVK